MSIAFDQFVQAFHSHRTQDPTDRLVLGLGDVGRLSDPSIAQTEREVARARALLAELAAIDRSTLSFDEALDADLAELMLERQVHQATLQFNGRTTQQQNPRAADGIGDGLFLLFANDPRPDHDRLADVTSRLQGAPAYLQGVLDCLDTPVARWVDIDCAKIAELPGLFASMVAWSGRTGFADHEALVAAAEATETSLKAYVEALRAMPTTTSLHLDRADAQRVVALNGIDLDLDELRDLAQRFLSDTAQIIETLRQRLVVKYELPADTSAPELQRHLAAHYRVKTPTGQMQDVVDRYEAARTRILEWIEARDLFPVFAEQDMRILCTPPFMEPSIPAGAMMSPPPFRDGVRTSLVYLTLKPELLDEHTEIGIPSMMVHEGIPGHHLQLATAGLHPSIIRRHYQGNEHAEGWTTMLEDYMLDEGFMGELTDEARFCGKRDLSRIGARVAIDLFFLTGDRQMLQVGVPCDLSSPDPFVAAGNLLEAVTGFVPGRVQAELNWYSQERGYPMSYLVGNELVWRLKRELAEAQAGQLEGQALDRVFHRIYLHSGNMPVTYLWRVFRHEGLLAA